MVVVDRGQDDYVLAVGDAGGDVARALVHVKEAWADSPSVPAADLAYFDTGTSGWVVERINYAAIVGRHAADPEIRQRDFDSGLQHQRVSPSNRQPVELYLLEHRQQHREFQCRKAVAIGQHRHDGLVR
jgi:hypothetical protein